MDACPAGSGWPSLEWVPISRLRTRLQPLRGNRGPGSRARQLGPAALRVVLTDEGEYELLDGFKRLARWRLMGLEQVPVMVEKSCSSAQRKALLLEAKRPPRTISPMDEARVVSSLRHDDMLGPAGIAHVCGRKRRWVMQRLTLAEQLCEPLQRRLDEGTLGVTLAHALCALGDDEQQAVAESVDRHRLKAHEALSVLSAYRVADSESERRQILDNPLQLVRPQNRSVSPMGALATRLESRLDAVREALGVIDEFQLPDEGLSAAERRRLEAGHQGALLELLDKARKLAHEQLGITPPHKERDDETSTRQREPAEPRADDADRGAARDEIRHAQDLAQARPEQETRPQCAGFDGTSRCTDEEDLEAQGVEQARRLPRRDPHQGREESHGIEDPARDHREGIRRRAHDPGRLHQDPARAPDAEKEGLATIRNSTS